MVCITLSRNICENIEELLKEGLEGLQCLVVQKRRKDHKNDSVVRGQKERMS